MSSEQVPKTEEQGEVDLQDEAASALPPKYANVLHNDDYTSMEFVILVLKKYFQKNSDEADQLMWRVHKEGRAVVGIYPYDIAETKAMQVSQEARRRGFPLCCTVEPIDGAS